MQHFYQEIQGWFTYPEFYSEMVKRFPDGSTFVEVGTWKGKSAAYMQVEILNAKKDIDFHVVDTWEINEETAFEPLLQTKDALYNHFLDNIVSVKESIKIHRGCSRTVAGEFQDGSLDFVFIDAAHDYGNVVADICAWLPKLKKTGIISGHDIHHQPIQRAILDTIGEYSQTYEDIWFVEVDKIVLPPRISGKTIVQVGAGVGRDHVYDMVKDMHGCRIVLVEPMNFHMDKLKECYSHVQKNNSVAFIASCILPENKAQEVTVYYSVDDAPEYQVASIDKQHVLKHGYSEESIRAVISPSITLSKLLSDYGLSKIDYLFLDIEGIDAEVILSFDLNRYDIQNIQIEHLHLGGNAEAVNAKFLNAGYVVANAIGSSGFDTMFTKEVKGEVVGSEENALKGKKVYDCFPFFNELDLLEIRLNVTSPYVDYWVISESNKTHSGIDKPFYLRDNLSRFEKFKDRIIIINYEHLGGSAWKTENESRNCIGRYLSEIARPNDVVILSDCDEIPNLAKVDFSINKKQRLEMYLFYYYLNCYDSAGWRGSVVFSVEALKNSTAHQQRYADDSDEVIIKEAGWHWSYCGGAQKIKAKLEAYAHQEYNTDEFKDVEKIASLIEKGEDVLGRGVKYTFVPMDERYPEYLLKNINNYYHLIHKLC